MVEPKTRAPRCTPCLACAANKAERWCFYVNRGSLLVLGVALCLALVGPAASTAQAAAPRVTSATRVPLVAAQGDRISVTATVRGTGKRAVIGLVLGDSTGSAKGGVALGKGVKVSHRGTKEVASEFRAHAAASVEPIRGMISNPTRSLHSAIHLSSRLGSSVSIS